MQDTNSAGSVSGRSEDVRDVVLAALEIAKQEVVQVSATGGVRLPKRRGRLGAFIALPRDMDGDELLSVANESIAGFFQHYPSATPEDLGLLRSIIRSDLATAMRSEQRRAKGVEIPPGLTRDSLGEQLDFVELTDGGIITLAQAEALTLFREGYSQEQIAAILKISRAAVEFRIAAGKANLQKFFSSTYHKDPRAAIVGRADRDANTATEH